MIPLVGMLAGIGVVGVGIWAVTRPKPSAPRIEGPLPYDRSTDGFPPDACRVGDTRIVLADAYSIPVVGTVYQCQGGPEACVRDAEGRTECGDLQ